MKGVFVSVDIFFNLRFLIHKRKKNCIMNACLLGNEPIEL